MMVLEYWFLTSGAEDKNIWAEIISELWLWPSNYVYPKALWSSEQVAQAVIILRTSQTRQQETEVKIPTKFIVRQDRAFSPFSSAWTKSLTQYYSYTSIWIRKSKECGRWECFSLQGQSQRQKDVLIFLRIDCKLESEEENPDNALD